MFVISQPTLKVICRANVDSLVSKLNDVDIIHVTILAPRRSLRELWGTPSVSNKRKLFSIVRWQCHP